MSRGKSYVGGSGADAIAATIARGTAGDNAALRNRGSDKEDTNQPLAPSELVRNEGISEAAAEDTKEISEHGEDTCILASF